MSKLGETTVYPRVTNAEEFAQSMSDILSQAFDELSGVGLNIEFVTRDEDATPAHTQDTRFDRHEDGT